MSMTQEEAIEILRKLPIGLMDLTNEQKWDLTESVDLDLAALRPVSREQVEKVWRGEWIDCSNGWMCSRCECDNTYAKPFCPRCGAAMTDKAMEMVMKRMEAMKDGSTTD